MDRALKARLNARPGRAPERQPFNVLFGLPDDGKALIKLVDDGAKLDFVLPGTVDLVPHLPATRYDLNLIYLLPGKQGSVKLRAGPLLNHIGDADICSEALKVAEQIVARSGRPCFNHPAAIAATTRDQVSRTLSGIAGLTVPKTIRVPGKDAHHLRSTIEAAGLRYPVLVRVSGSHRGMNMVRVDSPQGLDAAERLKRASHSALYVTEFHDFGNDDGRFRKYRIVVVGDDIFLRHMVTADDWLIYGERRAPNTREEEIAAFERFGRDTGLRLRPMFQEIARRLDLDFFGTDCSIDSSGQVLLFEANACMGILRRFTQRDATDAARKAKDGAIDAIQAAVEGRLAAPATWRHSARLAARDTAAV